MFNFKPKDDLFFELFISGSKIINSSATELRLLMNNLQNPEEILEKLTALEHEGDSITHKLIEHTKKMFITPLDREDIFRITKDIDNVTNRIEAAAHKFYSYNIDIPTPETVEIIDKIVTATEELIIIISELKTLNKSKIMLEKIIKVNVLENEADLIYRKAVKKLFDNADDVLYVMKWKDLYKYLEDSMDACERLANEVRGVVMKYA